MMQQYLRNPMAYLVPIALLLSACASTQLTSVWKDPSYQTRPARILVIGVARSPLNRRLFEDEFVRQLKSRGTDAIASYTVLSDEQQGNQADIAKKVAELGADTVLITRLVSKKVVQVYVPGTPYYPPPFYDTWPNYYAYGYRYMYTPGYITNDEYAVIETNLYDAKTDKLIWAASSETGINDSDKNLIKSYIKVMVNNMIGLGLLGK
jgi:predicted transcriptional regulator